MKKEMSDERLLTPIIRLTVLFLLLGMAACSGSSSLKVGWVEQSGFSQTTASYTTFSGTERRMLDADAGETISITYDVTVDEGALTLQIVDEEETAVWEQTFANDDAGLVDVPVENDGRYEIAIIGEETGGSFDLNWQVQ